MNSLYNFIKNYSISSIFTSLSAGYLFLFSLLIFNSSLSLAFEGGTFYITSNTSYATVFLNDNKIGETDERGGFFFDNITIGTYKITIEKEGYQKIERIIEIKGGGLTEQVHFALQPKTPSALPKPVPEASSPIPLESPSEKIEVPQKPPEKIAKEKPSVPIPSSPPQRKTETPRKLLEPITKIKPDFPDSPSIEQEKIETQKEVIESAIEVKPPVSPVPTQPVTQNNGISSSRFSIISFLERMYSPWLIFLILLFLIGIGLLVFFINKNLNKKKSLMMKKDAVIVGKTDAKKTEMTIPFGRPGIIDTQTIGDYRILENIDSGGMAYIYKATHVRKGGVVALKVPCEQFQNDKIFVERFRREAELGKKLHNENIIHIYESGITKDGITYIAMEYLDVIDLRKYIRTYGRMSIKEVLNTIIPVCRALDYAHVKGVIHRDIKPENIMLPREKGKGRIVLMDFGIARALYLGTVGTKTAFLGTPYYMSPDQILSEEIDGRSDIYSLGVVFFELLIGQWPFSDMDALRIVYHHLESPPPRLTSISPGIPTAIESIVLKMLAKKPEDRYQSIETLLVTLQEYMLKEGIEIE